MGFLADGFEKRFHPAQEPPDWVRTDLLSGETDAGINVTPDTALTYSAVFACIRILAESLSSLPLVTYERMSQTERQRANDHPLYSLLHDTPNPEMTSLEFRETLQGHLTGWGNAYAEIEWARSGYPRYLWPLRPDRMRVARENGSLVYYYRIRTGDKEVPLRPLNVLHLRGLGGDGIMGYSPIRLHRESIGLGKAAERFGAKFFGNGASVGGVLQHPGSLSDKAYKRLQGSWEKEHGGLDKAMRTAILEEGIEYHRVGIPPEDAQFLETRKFQVTDVARIYRIPPHMLADLDRATFSNIEHLSLEFVVFTLMPWFVRWEQRIHLQLMSKADRKRYFVEHLVAGLLRGDIKSRYEAYAIGRQNGFLSANDIRRMENMNPIPSGDVYLVPLNMIPAPQAGLMASSEDNAPPANENGRSLPPATQLRLMDGNGREERALRSGAMRHRLQQVHARIYEDVLARVLRREINDVGAAARKFLGRRSLAEFGAWLHDFYAEHETFTREQLAPVTTSYGELVADEAAAEVGVERPDMTRFVGGYLRDYATRHVARSEKQIRQALGLLPDSEPPEDEMTSLETVFEDWRDRRPAGDALDESVRANNAISKFVYVLSGITVLRWLSFGDNCPYCDQLNGSTVGVDVNFIAAGESFGPEDEAPLIPSRNIGHPPAHRGCDCMVVSD